MSIAGGPEQLGLVSAEQYGVDRHRNGDPAYGIIASGHGVECLRFEATKSEEAALARVAMLTCTVTGRRISRALCSYRFEGKYAQLWLSFSLFEEAGISSLSVERDSTFCMRKASC